MDGGATVTDVAASESGFDSAGWPKNTLQELICSNSLKKGLVIVDTRYFGVMFLQII